MKKHTYRITVEVIGEENQEHKLDTRFTAAGGALNATVL